MKPLAIVILVFFITTTSCKKQVVISGESYTAMVEAAYQLSVDKDSLQQVDALEMYENAFAKFPDSITDYSIYEASVVASQIKAFDKAFSYLERTAKLVEDEMGFPGWDYILGEYADEDYKNLMQDSRWLALYETALNDRKQFFERLKAEEKEFFNSRKNEDTAIFEANELYQHLKTSNNYLSKKQQNYSIAFKINDTTSTSYFVHLPKSYTPSKKYTVLFYLHGAVRGNALSVFETKLNLMYDNRRYTKRADANNVILVFPKGNKDFNWMLKDDGFFMVPEIVKQLKKALNIDDNKVFISGHSNGATGSFSYLMKQPTAFAGFYGFNTYPKVFTGGAFIKNVLSRSFINFSTDQDYYYPPNANDSLNVLMTDLKADYKDHRYNGFPHWFPAFEASEPAYDILFDDLLHRKRQPFPKTIQWEFDDNAYGTMDWISNATLDTVRAKKGWHKTLNFDIVKWLKLDKKDSMVTVDVARKAFDFPRASGKIVASYEANQFTVTASRIGAFSIAISPEMVDLNTPVKVVLNGTLVFDKVLTYDKQFMLEQWHANRDRSQLWVNYIRVIIE